MPSDLLIDKTHFAEDLFEVVDGYMTHNENKQKKLIDVCTVEVQWQDATKTKVPLIIRKFCIIYTEDLEAVNFN